MPDWSSEIRKRLAGLAAMHDDARPATTWIDWYVTRLERALAAGADDAESDADAGTASGLREDQAAAALLLALGIGCFAFARLADDRYVQMPADDLSDLSSWYALVGDSVIAGSRRPLLQHKPVEMSSIEPMHGGPAIAPVRDKCGNALFPCDANQALYKAVITVAVDRWRKPQHRCADSTCRQRRHRLLRLAGGVGIGHIPLLRASLGVERARSRK